MSIRRTYNTNRVGRGFPVRGEDEPRGKSNAKAPCLLFLEAL